MPSQRTGNAGRPPAGAGAEIDKRAIEATNALQVSPQMRQAALALARTQDYAEAAEQAGTSPETVRQWTRHPDFVRAVGWVVIGLADNGD